MPLACVSRVKAIVLECEALLGASIKPGYFIEKHRKAWR